MTLFQGFAARGQDRPERGLYAASAGTTALIVALACGAAVLMVALLAVQTRVPFSDLTRDPLAILGKKGAPHLGFLSNVGALLWCTTAAVCAFIGLRLVVDGGGRRPGLFLLATAGFTAVLLIDDFFMVHENLKMRLAYGDVALFTLYGLGALCYGAAFAGVLRDLGFWAPLLAVGLLGVSVVTDLIHLTAVVEGVWPWVLEDGSKFVGLAVWTAFHLRAAWVLDGGGRRE